MNSTEMKTNMAVRHGIEEQFHDVKAVHGKEDFYNYGALDIADQCLWDYLGDLSGKRLLEIGCGDGSATLRFARAGAHVTAIDISGEMVNLTKQAAESHGLSAQVQAIHVSVEDIDFPADSFDVVYGHSVLHHLNLDIAIPLLLKAMKKDAIAAFLEPLDHNPILNTFRKLTPHRRTPTEQPLQLSQLSELSQAFSAWEHREFYFLSLLSFIFYYGVHSRKWFQKTIRMLEPADRWLFKHIPSLSRYAWVTVVRYIK